MLIHSPKQHKTITLSEPQGTLKTRRTNMKCKPNCAPGRTLSKTRLASCSGGILAGSTGEFWRAAPARYWPDTRPDPPARDTQRDARRDSLASRSGGILGGIHCLAALAGYSADPLASCSGGILGGGVVWKHRKRGFHSNSPFLSGGEKHNQLIENIPL